MTKKLVPAAICYGILFILLLFLLCTSNILFRTPSIKTIIVLLYVHVAVAMFINCAVLWVLVYQKDKGQ